MSKIIIENRSDLPDLAVLDLICRIVKLGRISNDEKQYCYLYVADHNGIAVQISSHLNKCSDKFIVFQKSKETNETIKLEA